MQIEAPKIIDKTAITPRSKAKIENIDKFVNKIN